MATIVTDQMEDLANDLAALLMRSGSPQTEEEAQLAARTLAVLQSGAVEVLAGGLAEWTLRNGPIYVDGNKEQAYAHWEKHTTTISDDQGLWEFLSANGIDPDLHKRTDLVSVKTLMTGSEPLVGIERFIGVDVTYSFGLKKNLLKKPKKAVGVNGMVEPTSKGPRYGVGPEGISQRAKVVKFTPGEMPAVEGLTVPVCGVMPPPRVVAVAAKPKRRKTAKR